MRGFVGTLHASTGGERPHAIERVLEGLPYRQRAEGTARSPCAEIRYPPSVCRARLRDHDRHRVRHPLNVEEPVRVGELVGAITDR